MIAAVQTAETHYRSTLTTLQFASRARDISMCLGEPGGAEQPSNVGTISTAEVAFLEGKINDLRSRLSRREAEIGNLESLIASRDSRHETELATQLASARSQAAADVTAMKRQLDALVVERSRAKAEAEYALAMADLKLCEARDEARACASNSRLGQRTVALRPYNLAPISSDPRTHRAGP